ncbi:cytochrome P450 [Mycolicibacterium septicum]|uniref:cytochrome P450 n=1 Tax=Mycolicibacterium septicum TaxID=98668 RepID=UPI001AFA0FDE|nr:cytochrome P450 [Mycolicibacterium septicum]QRY50207.1 cytochrome P450 [Mycolicibacterium septicum]
MAKSGITPRLRFAHAVAAWYDAEAYFRRRSRRGRPFGMSIPGLGEVLFAAHAEHVREFLTIPSSTLTPPMPNPIEPVVGDGSIILLDGMPHKRERARFLPALHGERIRRYAGAMAQAAEKEIESWRPGMSIDARDAAQSITLRIIIRTVFGIDDHVRTDHYVRTVKSMMRNYVAPFMFFPALRRAPFGLGPWRRFSQRRVELDGLLSEQIALRRRTGTDGYDDVLSILLSDGQAGDRSDGEVLQQLRTLLVSGHETSATTLAWALFHIHADDVVRRRLLAELADNPPAEDMPKLPYLGAVISETLRMHPTVSIVVRQLKSPTEAWQVPRAAGDVIGVSLPALHADPSIWPDPGRFDPDRFLARKPPPAEYAPFGYGHRRCPGAAFAALELSIVLGTVLSRVELRRPDGKRMRKPPRSIPRGVAAVPNRPIRMQVVRKLPPPPDTKRGWES